MSRLTDVLGREEPFSNQQVNQVMDLVAD